MLSLSMQLLPCHTGAKGVLKELQGESLGLVLTGGLLPYSGLLIPAIQEALE